MKIRKLLTGMCISAILTAAASFIVAAEPDFTVTEMVSAAAGTGSATAETGSATTEAASSAAKSYFTAAETGSAVTETVSAAEETGSAAAETVSASPSLVSMGVFKTTGYCPCRRCCGKWGGRTATGVPATASHTIAVDPRVIPYGSRVMINGVIYTAEDCGGGVNGSHIDIFFNSHSEARRHGVQYAEIFLLQA